MILLSLLALAGAAERTDAPPGLRGDVDVAYHGSILFGGLEESGEIYGRRRLQRHDIVVSGEFSPTDGLVIGIAVPTTASMVQTWTDARTITYDPALESGVFAVGDPLDDAARLEARGSQGVWLGVGALPYSEDLFGGHVTWRLDARYRTGSSKKNLWTESDGRRGAHMGGSAWALSAAFSTHRGPAEPFLHLGYLHEGEVLVDLGGDDLQTVHPSSEVGGGGGVSLRITDDGSSSAALELSLGFSYVGWGQLPSGVFLPDVLDASRGLVVVRGDHLLGRVGVAIDAIIATYVDLRVGAEARYRTPHRFEDVYLARTSGDTFEIAWTAALGGRFR